MNNKHIVTETEKGILSFTCRCGDIVNIDTRKLCEENARLRRALAPILQHADSHDYAPPIRFPVMECREIKEKVNQ